ncbi:DUF2946 family protein [Azospirillum soli]|uniref:DUF2946 family protein n=1 Tax=Azospirillum soli TaxID=1304799 RepID=UPI001AE818B4|nr:DUF2946 family protein [Azospirillum soli]MBP2311713.1 hypothetical protein [Azospirillum soli]
MTKGATAWLAMLVLVFHAVVMATHVPPPLAALTMQVAAAAAEAPPCHQGHDKAPAGKATHVTYCPICLSLHGGKLLGPAAGPLLVVPVAVAVAMPLPSMDAAPGERPVPPFSARAPPAVV